MYIYKYLSSYLSIYSSVDSYVISMSWLLWVTLQWTLRLMYLFELGFSFLDKLSRSGIAGAYGVCVLSHFSCVRLFATPGTVACQAPLSVEFSRWEILEWVAMPSSGDHMVVLFSIVWETARLFPIVAAPIYSPTNRARGIHLLHILTSTSCFLFFA